MGAIEVSSGEIAATDASKRTWSFPLPVQPWATVSAPSSLAVFARYFAISGRDNAETNG